MKNNLPRGSQALGLAVPRRLGRERAGEGGLKWGHLADAAGDATGHGGSWDSNPVFRFVFVSVQVQCPAPYVRLWEEFIPSFRKYLIRP